MKTSARLLRLLSLLQSRRDWAGADLAERLGVTTRTLRRDVARLRDLGYPIAASPGVAGGYRMRAGATLPPLLLDDDEAVAVAVGLRAAAGGVAGIEEASLRALAKLEQVLPARLRHRVEALHTATVRLPDLAATVTPEVLTTIAEACRSHLRLRFEYRDRAGEPTVRGVEPYRVVHTGRRWYLVAWDIDRDEWRTFRVDRMAPPVATGGRFVPRDPPDAAAFVGHAVTTAPYRYRARVRLAAPASQIAAAVPPTVGVVEALDERTCVLTVGAHSLDLIAVHLAALGAEFTVLEPPELAAHLRTLAGRLARAADPGTRPAGSPRAPATVRRRDGG